VANKKYDGPRPYIPADIDRKIRVEAGHCCSISRCPIVVGLEIHHIDHNRENNAPENLILLCEMHHTLAHENKTDRKALRLYKLKLNTRESHSSAVDQKAYNYLKLKISEQLISDLRQASFLGIIRANVVNEIHALPFVWSSPYAKFEDAEMEEMSRALRASAEMLSRTLARKSYGSRSSIGDYEVPPEYDTNRIHEDAGEIAHKGREVCAYYDRLVQAAVKKGIYPVF
jgi:hypothetical protein